MEEKVFLFTQASLTAAFKRWWSDQREGKCEPHEVVAKKDLDVLAAESADILISCLQQGE